jgi:hypothetical protein
MLPLEELDWLGIRDLYEQRRAVHQRASALMRAKKKVAFAELVLGVSDPAGNFSASRHALGPRVLALNGNAENRVFRIAAQFLRLSTATPVPTLVRAAGLQYFQIGVGSEVSCVINPKVCWVANRRTIYAHLLLKHNGDTSRANQELDLYRDDDADSEMHYSIWGTLHGELADSMPTIVKDGAAAARRAGVAAGALTFLWGDAVADALYEQYHA